jgi:phospholipid transport system substrate-binding protein
MKTSFLIDALPFDRRAFLAGAAAMAVAIPGGAAHALTLAEARSLIDRVLSEIMGIINSGRSEAAMLSEFEGVFARHADVNIIAQSALGPPARQASAAQLRAFTAAFQGYMARKYGRRFREFIGATIQVTGGQQVQSFFEVISVANLRGRPPFEVRWHVSDRSSRNLFFNMIIEGVNMLSVERQEIGAMLEQRRGDIDRLIADLQRMG